MFRQRIPKWQKYQWLQAIYNPLWTFLVTLTIGGLWNSDWGLRIPSRSSNKQSSNILINKFCTKTIWRQKGPKKWNNFCISFVCITNIEICRYFRYVSISLSPERCLFFVFSCCIRGRGNVLCSPLYKIKYNQCEIKRLWKTRNNDYAQSLSRNKVCTFFLMRHVHVWHNNNNIT